MLLLLAALWTVRPALAQSVEDIPTEAVDRTVLLPADLATLDNPRYRWSHLQTERFIVHFERRMFANRVARMAEQFYEIISADLPGQRDRLAPARSHIFIFRHARDWQQAVEGQPGLEPWAASFVRGHVMYLQETGTDTSAKMEVLAHEMAHLVFNRFLTVRLPLWMNEGLAEYYGEFAYRAARGMGQSRRSAFPPLRRRTPLTELLHATTYPREAADIRRFYDTSKYVIGFLKLRFTEDRWAAFLQQVLDGAQPLPALLETYGWPDIAAMERDFARFAR